MAVYSINVTEIPQAWGLRKGCMGKIANLRYGCRCGFSMSRVQFLQSLSSLRKDFCIAAPSVLCLDSAWRLHFFPLCFCDMVITEQVHYSFYLKLVPLR